MGIDYGRNRVGIALTDEEGNIALPHAVFPNDRMLLPDVAELVREKSVATVVIGESVTHAGAENPIMAEIRRFKADLERELGIPVELEPEHFSSFEASRFQGKEKGKGKASDASAAAIILENYLAKHRHA